MRQNSDIERHPSGHESRVSNCLRVALLAVLAGCSAPDASHETQKSVTSLSTASVSSFEAKKSRPTFNITQARLALTPDSDKTTNIAEVYPDDKKLVIIINGDKSEIHTENVKRAVEVLNDKGFRKFYVASPQTLAVPDAETQIKQYAGSGEGVDDLFAQAEADKAIEKKGLVFFYATGNGSIKGSGEVCLELSDQCYGGRKLVQKLQGIKEHEAQGLFVIDAHYGYALPRVILHSGINGVAFSPASDDGYRGCGQFTPALFEGIRDSRDINADELSEPIEWFRFAMVNFQRKVSNAGEGTFYESRNELSRENLDRYMKNRQTLVIRIGATWCRACKLSETVLDRVNEVVGDQIKIMKITTDTNSESDELLKTLNLDVKLLPTTVIVQPDQKNTIVVESESAGSILRKLSDLGITPNKDH